MLEGNAASYDLCVFATFAGATPSVVKELWPQVSYHLLCPVHTTLIIRAFTLQMSNVKWVHALSAGVDSLVPTLRECEGAAQLPVMNTTVDKLIIGIRGVQSVQTDTRMYLSNDAIEAWCRVWHAAPNRVRS